jgi:hypothetical protein
VESCSIYSYGPFDICLWDIAERWLVSRSTDCWENIGTKVRFCASLFVLKTPQAYADQAAGFKARLARLQATSTRDYEFDSRLTACVEAVAPV